MEGLAIVRGDHMTTPAAARIRGSAVDSSDHRRRVIAAALSAVIALMTVVTTAGAAAPKTVEIVAHMIKQGPGQGTGTFVATGGAVESGLVCERGTVVGIGGKLVGWQSGQKAQFRSRVELNCADGSGTFVVQREIHIVFGGDEPFGWVILSGTGDYEALRGSGGGVTTENTEMSNTNIYDGFLVP